MATVSCSAPEYPKGKKNMLPYKEKTGQDLLNILFATVLIMFFIAWLVNLTCVNVVPVFWPNRPYLSYWDTFLLLFCLDTAASYLKKIFHG